MDHALTLTRQIDASATAVWQCWTQADLLVQWFAPKPVQTIHAEVDPTPGGCFDTTMLVPDTGEMTARGCVLLADPGRQLTITNMMTAGFQPVQHAGDDHSFPYVIDLTMHPDAGGCRYDVRILHADAAGAARHRAMGFDTGWGTATDQLAALAATLDL